MCILLLRFENDVFYSFYINLCMRFIDKWLRSENTNAFSNDLNSIDKPSQERMKKPYLCTLIYTILPSFHFIFISLNSKCLLNWTVEKKSKIQYNKNSSYNTWVHIFTLYSRILQRNYFQNFYHQLFISKAIILLLS